MTKMQSFILTAITDQTEMMRNSFRTLIAEEIDSSIKSTKLWVEDRLNDTSQLLAVPGIIGDRGVDGLLKKCPYKSFTEFVNITIQR